MRKTITRTYGSKHNKSVVKSTIDDDFYMLLTLFVCANCISFMLGLWL
jgi:hypothetical protein